MLAARPRELRPSAPGCQTARGICGSLVLFRQNRITLGAGLIFGFAALVLSFAAHAASPAESFIEDSVRKGSAILNSSPRDPGERDRAFRDFILSITDMKRVALFTLGPYAKDAPEQVLTDFVAAYTDLDVALYRSGFNSYAKSTKITGSVTRAADDVIVNAEVSDVNGKSEPAKIAFRVRKDDKGGDIITDVELAGVWLALSQRQEFTSYLQLNGGDIPSLSRGLETHIAK